MKRVLYLLLCLCVVFCSCVSVKCYAVNTPHASPHYTWFDPSKVPFYDYPDYIQDIVYNKLSSFSYDENSQQEAPFIACVASSSNCTLYVGINAVIGNIYNSTSNALIAYGILWKHTRYAATANLSVMYKAVIDTNYNITENWAAFNGSTFTADTNTTQYQTISSLSNNANRDIYLYGINSCRPWNGENASYTNPASSKRSFMYRAGVFSAITSDLINSQFSNTYLSIFSPQTAEQEAQNTRKGIWDTLKSIPSLILDGIKSLFVPSDEELENARNDLGQTARDHLGIIYEGGDFIVSLIQMLVDYSPQTDGYVLTFPVLKAPYIDDTGEVQQQQLSGEATYNLSDLVATAPFDRLYTAYKAIIWVMFLLALLYLAERKFVSIFGGGNE